MSHKTQSQSARFAILSATLCSLAAPAIAADRSCPGRIEIARDARLVEVRGETFVQLKGRGRLTAPLKINGDEVANVRGHFWRARVPLDTIRRSAAPFARTIEVEARCASAETSAVSAARAVRLPVGLLGGTTQLASIELAAK